MAEIANLKAKFRITEAEINSIARLIIEAHTSGVTDVSEPHAVILGGQPGSGKGELITQAQNLLGQNIVICNADEYRSMHPHFKEIVKNHEDLYPELTAEYAQLWNERLKDHCETNRFNYILETTFSSGDRMNETIKAAKAKGYKVSLMILAVNKHLSFLGTRLRYESMYERDGYGRTVPKVAHDDRYEMVVDTLERVQTAGLYDHIYIYGRAGRKKLKGMVNGLRLISADSPTPLQDYIAERGKDWSENDLRYFTSDILQLIKQMIQRKASYEDLGRIFDMFDLENVDSLLSSSEKEGEADGNLND